MFDPIYLEASLGRIEDVTANERKCHSDQDSRSSPSSPSSSSSQDRHQIKSQGATLSLRTGITRTSSRTPFLRESLLSQPYPISETEYEIKERMRLTGLMISNTPSQHHKLSSIIDVDAAENADQQSMMEVTVDDFVLSAEEASSFTDLDATTIQEDPNGFWNTPVHVATTLSMDDMNACSTVPFSVTFSSNQDNPYMMDDEEICSDASPIRSVDMEW